MSAKPPTQDSLKEADQSKSCWLVSSISGLLLLAVHATYLGYAIVNNNTWHIVLASMLITLSLFAFISVCGSYSFWHSVLTLNKICFFAVSLIFVGVVSACGTAIKVFKGQTTHTNDEASSRDKDVKWFTTLLIISCVEYVLLAALFLPLFCLYTKVKYEEVPDEKTSISAAKGKDKSYSDVDKPGM